ncbi:unnamed protein product [Caenorhabditis brenneri]
MSTGTFESLTNKILIAIAGAEPPFECQGDYKPYSRANNAGKCEILKNQAVIVTMVPNDKYLREERKKFLEMLGKRVDWNFERFMNGEAEKVHSKFLAEKYFLARYNTEKGYKELEKDQARVEENKMKRIRMTDRVLRPYLNQYQPPEKRILVAQNITFNELDPIPVYCDITKGLEDLVIPKTLAFDYTDCNFVNRELEPELVEAVGMSLDPRNHIKCDCDGKNILCYENEDCPCYKMNRDMQSLRGVNNTEPPCEFHTLRPITISYPFNIMYENCGFACSNSCGCKGKCYNNALLLPHRFLFPLEIFRSDSVIGFQVMCPVFIPAGTPILEFNGEILELGTLEKLGPLYKEHLAYSLQCSFSDDKDFRNFFNRLNFTDEYKEVLTKLYRKKEFWIDPTNFGNVGRMISHSCCPNLEVLRVYRKSLSPAHVSLAMVAIEDIYPRTPFSFDYGPKYKIDSKRSLQRFCRCGLFSCQGKGNQNEEFKKLDTFNMALIIQKLHKMRREAYERNVMRED